MNFDPLKGNTKCVIVLGMHRSMTSLSSKGLHLSGCNMGNNLLGADHSNPYGHYEDVDFMELNKKILEAAGGRWDYPPGESKILETKGEFRNEIRDLVYSKEKELWGWKDPRTTLTIKLFLPFIKNPHFVICFREPIEVARSLAKRNGMKLERGMELAGIYNERLLIFLSECIGLGKWGLIGTPYEGKSI